MPEIACINTIVNIEFINFNKIKRQFYFKNLWTNTYDDLV